jgi:metal-responsive CopG/Arc/MetJ family transcriptional regulator
MKVQITLDDALMERVDAYADENYMSRSGLLSLAVTQYLNAAEVTKAIKEMAVCIRKIADNGTVDHETMEQLEDFERLSKMLVMK